MYNREDVSLGNKPSLTVYYDCFACRDQLVIKIDTMDGFDHGSGTAEAVKRGWRRRKFYDTVDPWFCSSECSHDSPQAEYCENYWKKEVKEADERNSWLGKVKVLLKW